MIVKIALLLWFGAFFISLVVTGKNRNWMAKLFVGGLCLLLLALFLKILGRVI